MSERAEDAYWNVDIAVGEGHFYDEPYTIRFSLHQAEETYYGRQELFPLTEKTGTRLYFHAKPYILLPHLTVQVTLSDPPREGVLGETEVADWEGMRHELLGNAQAWYYPHDKALVLWECFLEDQYRLADPIEDLNLQAVWKGFEQVVLERSRGVQRLYTSWEDIYERPVWQTFLEQQGYQHFDKAVFLKEVTGE